MGFVRVAAVAGQFYQSRADELRETIESYLADVTPDKTLVPKALIAPHAGYVYSGPVAASAYATLASVKDKIRRVVLLGPCHRVAVQGLALSGADSFQTPLGNIDIDKQAVSQILSLNQVQIFDATHDQEHSLEVHLPFLQVMLNDFKIVPLVVGEATPNQVAEVLDALWGGDETLIVVSSDLSHYLDYASARNLDQQTCQAIENLNPSAITSNGACGRFPVAGLLEVAKRRGLSVKTLDVRNSGDTAGSKDRVVGYGSWVFSEPGKISDHLSNNADETAFETSTRQLLADYGSDLLRLCAQSIDYGLANGKPLNISLEEYPEALRASGASFITLKKNGNLRGCIGSAQAYRPLVVDVAENAYKSAFGDPRFPHLSADERPETEISISLLSQQSSINFSSEDELLGQLRAGVDGLVIEDGTKRALFLPSVWSQLPSRDEFLRHLKAKAGMAPGYWSDTIKAWRFIAAEMSDSEF